MIDCLIDWLIDWLIYHAYLLIKPRLSRPFVVVVSGAIHSIEQRRSISERFCFVCLFVFFFAFWWMVIREKSGCRMGTNQDQIFNIIPVRLRRSPNINSRWQTLSRYLLTKGSVKEDENNLKNCFLFLFVFCFCLWLFCCLVFVCLFVFCLFLFVLFVCLFVCFFPFLVALATSILRVLEI